MAAACILLLIGKYIAGKRKGLGLTQKQPAGVDGTFLFKYYTRDEFKILPGFNVVNMRCLRQQAVFYIVVATTERKKVIHNVKRKY